MFQQKCTRKKLKIELGGLSRVGGLISVSDNFKPCLNSRILVPGFVPQNGVHDDATLMRVVFSTAVMPTEP